MTPAWIFEATKRGVFWEQKLRLNYYDFVKIFELMDAKKHLTEEGLATIIKIKSGMNTGRI